MRSLYWERMCIILVKMEYWCIFFSKRKIESLFTILSYCQYAPIKLETWRCQIGKLKCPQVCRVSKNLTSVRVISNPQCLKNAWSIKNQLGSSICSILLSLDNKIDVLGFQAHIITLIWPFLINNYNLNNGANAKNWILIKSAT